jgi:hypothetical protein
MHAVESVGDVADEPTDNLDEMLTELPEENHTRSESAIVLDAMAVVQSMKTSGLTKIHHLKTAFVKRIRHLTKGYGQGRVIFDQYLEVSLKNKTRAKRAQKTSSLEFVVHDEMNIAKVSLKEFLANSKTKSQLTELLAQALLETFKESKLERVVSYHDKVRPNAPDLLPDGMTTHGHEEADTMIPLHVVDIVRVSKLRTIDVWSPDTDVLVLLIDLAAIDHLGVLTTLRLLTGKGAKYRAIDVRDRVVALGPEKTRGLIGLHHFSGAD